MKKNYLTNQDMICCVTGIFVFLATQFFTFQRIQYGVNFFDEAFYACVPFRFLMGQKLFVHDLFLVQTFGLISYPLVKLHSYFNHDTEGIVYFLRFCFFTSSFLIGLFIVEVFSGRVPIGVAILLGSLSGLFVPGGIPSLSYNTMAGFFLIVGLLSAFRGLKNKNSYWMLLSGIALGLVALSYVTLFLITIVLLIAMILSKPKRSLIMSYICGATSVLLGPSLLLVSRNEQFKKALYFSREIGYSADKVGRLLSQIHSLFPLKIVLLMIGFYALIFLFKLKRISWGQVVLVLLMPVVALKLAYWSWGLQNHFLFYLSLFGPALFFLLPKTPDRDLLFTVVFMPSFFAGIVVMMTSAVGHQNIQVGILPATLVTLFFLWQFLHLKALTPFWLNCFLLALPAVCMMSYPDFLWDESPKSQLTTVVKNGPYKGLRTSPEKERYLRDISRSLKTHVDKNGILLVYPNFSAGYLIAGVEPAPGILSYQHSGIKLDSLLADEYLKAMNRKSRILKMNIWYAFPGLESPNTFDPNSAVIKLMNDSHQSLESNQWFTLFSPAAKSSSGSF
ncbi:MAG: hypothetical protein EBR01_12290 [Proteobacteria bacterium]|nr:hypothetical protein [Pseudomonadota bacterium]